MKSGMRRVFGVVAVLVSVTGHGVAQSHEGWFAEFHKAEQKSKAAGIPLLLHFYADWCGPCRAMERDVLGTAQVSKALSDGIVAVKVNSDNRQDLVRRFGVTSLPTDIFVSPEGTILGRFVGSPGRAGYIARLTRFRSSISVAETQTKAATVVVDASLRPRARFAAPTAGGTHRIAVRPTAPQQAATRGDTDTRVVLASQEASAQTNETSKPDGSSAKYELTTESRTGTTAAIQPRLTGALRPAVTNRIGLNGYCPVSLQSASEWQQGAADFKCEFQGVCYLLRTADDLERFRADPQKFAPVLHGCDPVALQTEKKMRTGAIELGARYRNRVFFFASRSNRDAFLRNPGQYAQPLERNVFDETSGQQADL